MTEKKKEVASWKAALAADAEKTALAERPVSTFISLKGGVMAINDDIIPGNMLECVIVANAHERTYYDRPYDADDDGPPACFAQAIDGQDLVPHSNVPEPVSSACKGCPKAEFGTALQGKGPACKTRRKMVVMPVSVLADPTKIGEAELATLAAPPTSVKNFSQYANKVASSAGLPPWAVKTMISVAPHPKKQFEVSFATTGPVVDEDCLAGIHGRIQEAEGLLLNPYTYDNDPKPEVKESSKY